MYIPPSRISVGSGIRTAQSMFVVGLARKIMDQDWLTGSIITVVRDPLRPGMFRCIDGWHRCLAGDILEQTGYLTVLPCRLMAHLEDYEETMVAYHENRAADDRVATAFIDSLEVCKKEYANIMAHNKPGYDPTPSDVGRMVTPPAPAGGAAPPKKTKAGAVGHWRSVMYVVKHFDDATFDRVIKLLRSQLDQVMLRLAETGGTGNCFEDEVRGIHQLFVTKSSLQKLATVSLVKEEKEEGPQNGPRSRPSSKDRLTIEEMRLYFHDILIEKALKYWRFDSHGRVQSRLSENQIFHENRATYVWWLEKNRSMDLWAPNDPLFGERPKKLDEYFDEQMARLVAGNDKKAESDAIQLHDALFAKPPTNREFALETRAVLERHFPGDLPRMLAEFKARGQKSWEAFKAREVARINRPAPADPTPEAEPEGMGDDDLPPPDAMDVSDESPARRSTRIRLRNSSGAGPSAMPESATAQGGGGAEESEESEEDAATKRARRETEAETRRREERELREQAAEERYDAGYNHHVVFAHSKWELLLQDKGANEWEPFHKRHDPSRDAKDNAAFDLIIVDGPWGVNKGRGATRDQQLSDDGRKKVMEAVNVHLAPNGQVLVICPEWEAGDWKKTITKEFAFRTTTAPINVIFDPSQCHRKRTPTNIYSCNHTVVVARREAAKDTEVARNLQGKGCGHMKRNIFPAASNIISGYIPPRDGLRGPDGKLLRVEEKAVELCMELVERFTNPKGRVLDMFAGSAAFGLACLKLNRSYVGCERDGEVHRLAKERLQAKVRVMMGLQTLPFPGSEEHPAVIPITKQRLGEFYGHLEAVKVVDIVPEGVDPDASPEVQVGQDLARMNIGLEVREVPGMGEGLFATRPLDYGTVVGCMWGKVYSDEGLREFCAKEKRTRRTLTRRAGMQDFLPTHPLLKELKPVLNGSMGCAMAKINCARGPNNRGSVVGKNCEIITAPMDMNLRVAWRTTVNEDVAKAWAYEGLFLVRLTANIEIGQQLLLDYGTEYWHGEDDDDSDGPEEVEEEE